MGDGFGGDTPFGEYEFGPPASVFPDRNSLYPPDIHDLVRSYEYSFDLPSNRDYSWHLHPYDDALPPSAGSYLSTHSSRRGRYPRGMPRRDNFPPPERNAPYVSDATAITPPPVAQGTNMVIIQGKPVLPSETPVFHNKVIIQGKPVR